MRHDRGLAGGLASLCLVAGTAGGDALLDCSDGLLTRILGLDLERATMRMVLLGGAVAAILAAIIVLNT